MTLFRSANKIDANTLCFFARFIIGLLFFGWFNVDEVERHWFHGAC